MRYTNGGRTPARDRKCDAYVSPNDPRVARELTARALRIRAEQADARYSAVIAARTGGKRNRFELTAAEERLPEIAAAYRAKVNADAMWQMFLLSNSGE